MKIIETKEQIRKNKIDKFLDWIFHMIGYGLVLIMATVLFPKTVQIDNSWFGFWALIAAIIIYLLNLTIKPIIVWLTLPITGLTLGIFYPFINVFILNIVSWVLGNHFNINGLIMSFIVAIFISIMNIFISSLIRNIMRKG